jgi:hypothetical protein
MTGIFSSLLGTTKSFFRFGGPSGAGVKNSSGVLQTRDSADSAFADFAAKWFRIQGANAANAVVLKAGTLAGDVALTFPTSLPGSTSFLTLDASGNIATASTPNSNADLVEVTAFTQGSATLTMFTPPANAVISRIVIEVSAAAAGGSPTITVGTSGTPSAYAASTDSDLKTAALYEIPVMASVGGSPSAVQAVITASAQTFSGNIYTYYSNPA